MEDRKGDGAWDPERVFRDTFKDQVWGLEKIQVWGGTKKSSGLGGYQERVSGLGGNEACSLGSGVRVKELGIRRALPVPSEERTTFKA